MKTTNILPVILMTVLFMSCTTKKEDPKPVAPAPATGTVEYIFQPKVGSVPFQMNTEYTSPKGEKYKVNAFKFFVSNIGLAKEDNAEAKAIPMKDDSAQVGIYLVDFSTPNATADDVMNCYKITFQVPAGEYVDPRFDIAVPREYNLSDITKNPYPVNKNRGMYWSWNSGFKFLVINGNTDAVPNYGNFHLSIGLNTRLIAYNFRGLLIASRLEKIKVEAGKTTKIYFTFDLNAMLTNTDGTLYSLKPIPGSDVADPSQVHGGFYSDILKANASNSVELKNIINP